MRRVYLAMVVIITLVIVIFALQNLNPVTLTLFGQHWRAPMALVAVAIYILGALTGGGLYSLIRTSYRKSRAAKP